MGSMAAYQIQDPVKDCLPLIGQYIPISHTFESRAALVHVLEEIHMHLGYSNAQFSDAYKREPGIPQKGIFISYNLAGDFDCSLSVIIDMHGKLHYVYADTQTNTMIKKDGVDMCEFPDTQLINLLDGFRHMANA